ncbi:MAG: hypothetical protein GY883_19610, partial [Shimia sp.]|nr:hypothetical protein [Shimia sp.]
MQALKTLIEQHEDWLTDRVIHYAKQKNFTQFSSTLREAWRISICGLSKPLTMFLDTAQDDSIPKEVALKAATEFGITQGIQHRARGIDLTDFLGLLKLYRNAYLDLASDKATDKEKAHCLQILIVEQFDAIELGLLEAWTKTETSERHWELQAHNRALTNEKNKYLTVFESIAEPAILLGPDQEPTHVNAAANRLLLGTHEPGAGYYGAQVSPHLASIIDTLLETADRPAAPITLDTPNGARSFEVSVQKMLDIS